MKKNTFISCVLICFLSFSLIAADNQMSVKDFALKLAKELNIDKDIKGDMLADIIKVFPENLQNIFSEFKGDMVTRLLSVEIFSYFLDANEIESLRMAGNENDILPQDQIDSLFEKCAKEGDVLTYIVPPTHSFINRVDGKIQELFQTPGNNTSGTTGY